MFWSYGLTVCKLVSLCALQGQEKTDDGVKKLNAWRAFQPWLPTVKNYLMFSSLLGDQWARFGSFERS